jgi:hypothetical protein
MEMTRNPKSNDTYKKMHKWTNILAIILLLSSKVTFGQISNSWTFKNELIGYMQTPKDTIYIQDRKKLKKIRGLKCTDTTATFKGFTNIGDKISISIHNKKFIHSNHTLDLSDTVFKFMHNEKRVDYLITKDLIDGRVAFGIDGNYPNIELSDIKIQWNNIRLTIPDSAFHNLYETHLCLEHLPVEAYVTKDKKLLYIYISASDGIASYCVKFVFSRQKYLTRIVNINEMTDGYDFLDGTAKDEE